MKEPIMLYDLKVVLRGGNVFTTNAVSREDYERIIRAIELRDSRRLFRRPSPMMRVDGKNSFGAFHVDDVVSVSIHRTNKQQT